MSNDLKSKLLQLQELVDLGLLPESEYQEQRKQLIAAAMGTKPNPSLQGATHVTPSIKSSSSLPGSTIVDPISHTAAVLQGATITEGSQAHFTSLPGSTLVDQAPQRTKPYPQSPSGPAKPHLEANYPKQLGNYRVLECIGAGGMGTVVRARHTNESWAQHQGGDVAIKFIHPHIAQNIDFQERFMQEAALGTSLHHPSLIMVYDVVQEGPWLGTVMQMIEGETLTSLIKADGLSISKTIALLKPLAAGLDYLHANKVIHRDLKPDNIKVKPDGTLVILDLGIAKDMLAKDSHTKPMTALGTSAWMAPEQIDAKHIGPEADRYALGLIAYVLLSGQLPWGKDISEARMLVCKLSEPPTPLYRLQPSLSKEFSQVVMRMLSIKAEDRIKGCLAFVAALEEVSEGKKKVTQPPKKNPVQPQPPSVKTKKKRKGNTLSDKNPYHLKGNSPKGSSSLENNAKNPFYIPKNSFGKQDKNLDRDEEEFYIDDLNDFNPFVVEGDPNARSQYSNDANPFQIHGSPDQHSTHEEVEYWCRQLSQKGRRSASCPICKATIDLSQMLRHMNDDHARDWKHSSKAPKDSFCFISTAVCQTRDLPDNCNELQILRRFRDEYMLLNPKYAPLVMKYYQIAPKVIEWIELQPDAHQRYHQIWRNSLLPAINAIENQKPELALQLYLHMVQTLQAEVLPL